MESSTVQTPAPRYRVVSLDRRPDAAPAKPDFTIGQVMRALAGCAGAQGKEIKAELSGGSTATGGATLPDDMFQELIVNVSHRMECVQAGARVVELLHDDLTIAKLSETIVLEDISLPQWRSENGPIAEDDPIFSADKLTPRSVAMLVKVPRELLEDGFEIGQRLEQFLYAVMAWRIDHGILRGSGAAPEPAGLLSLAPLQTAVETWLLDYGPLIHAYWRVRSYRLGADPTAVMLSSDGMGHLESRLVPYGDMPLAVPERLRALKMVPSNVLVGSGVEPYHVTAVVGDFSQLLVGWRGGVRIEVLRERFAGNHQIAFVVHARLGVAVLNRFAFLVDRRLKR